MKISTRTIAVSTRGDCDSVDITPQVADEMEKSGMKNGIAVLFVPGSTAGLTTIEYEPVFWRICLRLLSALRRLTSPIIMTSAGVMATAMPISARR